MPNRISEKGNYLKTFRTVLSIGTLIALAACGDKLPSNGGGPTSLNSHIELLVDGAFEGVDTLGQQDKDAFYSKNSKSAMRACVLDKIQNDPNYLDKNGWGGEGSNGKLTDGAAIYKAIAKYGINELNQESKMAYDTWNQILAKAIPPCIVE